MATVMIGCKLPNGLIIEYGGKSAKINGSQSEDGIIIVEKGEHIGITYDVDKELWEKWREVNKKHPVCVNQHIFETKSENSAKSQAKELKSNKTGLEQKTPEELTKVAGAGKLKETD